MEKKVNADNAWKEVVGDPQGVADAAGCAACNEDDTRSHCGRCSGTRQGNESKLEGELHELIQ